MLIATLLIDVLSLRLPGLICQYWMICSISPLPFRIEHEQPQKANASNDHILLLPSSISAPSTGTTAASAAAQAPAVCSILVSKNAGRYRLQADSFPAMLVVMEELERRLNAKINNGGSGGGGASSG